MSAAMREAARGVMSALFTRGKVTGAAVAGRTILSASGLEGEQKNGVELLLPPGYVALPLAGADVILCQVGTRDHQVALGGDSTGDAVAGLAPGECGLSMGEKYVLVRLTGVQLFAQGETLRKIVTDAFEAVYNGHSHAGPGAPPDSGHLMTAVHLSTTTEVGGS